jgi:tRNA1(Val) A37 N6-methylase TrmN6
VNQEDCTIDGFLGGRLAIAQPKVGFRAGHDTVLLAAAVPAREGDKILELGAGAGVAGLCVAARVAGASIRGIEIDAGLVDLANWNAQRNGMADRVRFEHGEARIIGPNEEFAHAFFNPPFHPESGEISPRPARDRAMRDALGAIGKWTMAALAATHAGGTVIAILRADRAGEMLSAVQGGATVFPLFPRVGEAAKRVIIRLTKGSAAPTRVAAGLVLHANGGNTDAAEAVLRHAAVLSLD